MFYFVNSLYVNFEDWVAIINYPLHEMYEQSFPKSIHGDMGNIKSILSVKKKYKNTYLFIINVIFL